MITHADLKTYGMANAIQSLKDDGIANYIKILKINIPDAHELVIEGINEANNNQFDNALKKFEQALAENPIDFDALLRAAFVYEFYKNLDHAINYYQKTAELQPNEPYIQLRISANHYYLKQYHAALASTRTALAMKPDFADAFFNQGLCFYELGRFEDALKSYNQSLAIRSNHFGTVFNIGMCLQVLTQYDDAIENYTKAIKIKPKESDAYFNRGLCFHNLGNFDKAIKDYEIVLEINKN